MMYIGTRGPPTNRARTSTTPSYTLVAQSSDFTEMPAEIFSPLLDEVISFSNLALCYKDWHL